MGKHTRNDPAAVFSQTCHLPYILVTNCQINFLVTIFLLNTTLGVWDCTHKSKTYYKNKLIFFIKILYNWIDIITQGYYYVRLCVITKNHLKHIEHFILKLN